MATYQDGLSALLAQQRYLTLTKHLSRSRCVPLRYLTHLLRAILLATKLEGPGYGLRWEWPLRAAVVGLAVSHVGLPPGQRRSNPY
ncbi:hypothetical protein V2G26_006458 [Clonostachys chloroleuca]